MKDESFYAEFGIPQFIEYFGDRFDRAVNKDVYAEYLKFWKGKTVNNVSFGRYIANFTEYQTKLFSVGGKKLRIFIKRESSTSV